MSNKNSLYKLVESFDGPVNLLEIGVAQGDSAEPLLQKFPDLRYTGLDEWRRRPDMQYEANKLKNWATQAHWDAIYEKVVKRLSKFGDRARIVRGDSHEELPHMAWKFDIIFVDGDHSYEGCLKDLELCVNRLRPGGVMWVDDVDYIGDVKRALHQFLKTHAAFKLRGSCILEPS